MALYIQYIVPMWPSHSLPGSVGLNCSLTIHSVSTVLPRVSVPFPFDQIMFHMHFFRFKYFLLIDIFFSHSLCPTMLSLSFLSGQITTLRLPGKPGNETIKDGGKHLGTFIQTSVLISLSCLPLSFSIFYIPFVISPISLSLMVLL